MKSAAEFTLARYYHTTCSEDQCGVVVRASDKGLRDPGSNLSSAMEADILTVRLLVGRHFSSIIIAVGRIDMRMQKSWQGGRRGKEQ